ncbi:MAG: AraC family ligand binding domain-containing protein [Thermoanaerobaculia bacterium]|jgi:mannose-6-phosphate isomerase-like protein (cupin superfamily)|nr:AraC family ligand binding domain-containing protein [Thermoanaerobaculia bacterium]MBP9825424.1 AraC family ligand binding domain-containing protein [Thermoanaerobaculia bacterium]
MRTRWFGLLVALAAASPTLAQSPAPAPAKAPPQATAIRSTEILAEAQRNPAGALADSVLRVVPIESSYNVGVSVVRRSRVEGKTPPDAIVHDAITEVYQILEGRGVLVTGGTLEAPTAFPLDGPIVRQIIGPSAFGKVILGGTRQEVGPGDIVVIPPHTAHGFVEITTEQILYTLIRIDPQQLLELRSKSN